MAAISDPFSFEQISLTEAKEGPMMRLLRSRKFRQLHMQFDMKPPEDVKLQLKDAGWTWNNKEHIYILSLKQGTGATTTIEAERLFKRIGNQLRQAQGLEPVTGVGSAKAEGYTPL